jgi:2-polyprenyl-6-methoxyphenol hydroxylase-like FAD-dependent oxidoreductase
VIVVGGGPVGLALAGDLGWRGLSALLVEQGDGSIYQPKMDGVNIRTMEFCRRWGLMDEVRACPYPSYFPQDMVYLTSMNGFELGREVFTKPSGGAEETASAPSPETRVRCPQNMFDPILQRFASSLASVELRYLTKFAGFEQDDEGVTVEVEDVASGRRERLRGSYVVGCDGASSDVRKALGLKMEGRPSLTYTTNIIFRCADLSKYHDKQLAYRHIFIGPEGTWGTMVAINGRDEWRVSIIGGAEQRALEEEEIHAAIRRMIGRDFPYELVSVLPWVRRELLAEHYGRGRAFLAGDAVHMMSPTGGFGMNTGIGDVVDLSWKLEGVLRGWAPPALLESYETERRPVGLRVIREASGNLMRMLAPGENPNLLDESLEGALTRYEVGRKFAATMLREWYKLGIDLGYTYDGSPICWPEHEAPGPVQPARNGARPLPPAGWLADGTPITPSLLREWQRLAVHQADHYPVALEWEELPAPSVMIYEPSARPGARAPHVRLSDGSSTLDLFGRGFALLVLGPVEGRPDTAPLAAAAESVGLPLHVHAIDDPRVYTAYRRRLVLVRPDGHVAWRADALPTEGAAALLDRVRGAAVLLAT